VSALGRLTLLGATGSIGASALDVVAELGESVEVVGLSCDASWLELAALAARWGPAVVAIADPTAARAARESGALDGIEILAGADGVRELASRPGADTVLNGIVGAAGLPATLAALAAGKRVALANKESLVVGGDLVTKAAGGTRWPAPDARLLPVDSEHNALWQLLEGRSRETVRRVVLTASGGPFRTWPLERLADATPEEALDHPTWSMGPKITIDSATLANKGLEIIEAHHLFGLPYEQIDVVVHPRSIVHGLVELIDGTILAELGVPDMRAPIHAALTHPARVARHGTTDLAALSGLEFEAPDEARFPLLELARAAGRAGGTAPAALNAANEVAVRAFLDGRIGFLDIARTCERVLETHDVEPARSVETLLSADHRARARASELVGLDRTSDVVPG